MSDPTRAKIAFGGVDFFQLLAIKHPLQSMLRRGLSATMRFRVVKDESALIVEDYYGSIESLKEALDKFIPKLHPVPGGSVSYSFNELNESEYTQLKPENTQSLNDQMSVLESILIDRDNQIDDCVNALEDLRKQYEAQVSRKEEDLGNLRKANQGLSVAKRRAEASARDTEHDLEDLKKSYHQLSILVEDIEKTKISEPRELIMQKINSTSSNLSTFGRDLERLLGGATISAEMVEIGKKPFYQFVNEKLPAQYQSDEEAIKILSINSPFSESEYYRSNRERYSKIDRALETLSSLGGLSDLLGGAIDITKALEAEKQLRTFKEEYESAERVYNENWERSRRLQGLKVHYEKARDVSDLISTVEKAIPCLISTRGNKTEVVLPNAGAYFGSQFQQLGYSFRENNGPLIADIQLSSEADAVAEHAIITRKIFDAQESAQFHELGFRLQIYSLLEKSE